MTAKYTKFVKGGDMSTDKFILEVALKAVTGELDRLVGCCTGVDGSISAPKTGDFMRARAALPQGYKNAFDKKDRK